MMRSQRRMVMVVLALAAYCLMMTPQWAKASERGELLYDNHCQSCHDKSVHTREESRVKSIESLRAWVVAWSVHNGLFWGNEEVADITEYLNRSIYQFAD